MQHEPPLHARMLARAAGRPKALLSFAVTLIFGVLVLTEALNYQMGVINRMGPGYFPTVLGVGLIILSGILLFERESETGEGLPRSFVPIIVIPLAMGVFAYMIERFGLYPATTALVVIASLAERGFRPLLVLALASLVPITVTVLFVHLLGLPIKTIGW